MLLLRPVVETEGVVPPISLTETPEMVFFAPIFPALRALSVREAARAWVLLDMLCLDATRRIEDDLVQRYAENPDSEADWRLALTVDGCPACDTLWAKLTDSYAAFSRRWEDGLCAPMDFGAPLSVALRDDRLPWQCCNNHRTILKIYDAGKVFRKHAGGLLAPSILALLRHSDDPTVVVTALEALSLVVNKYCYLDVYVSVLARLYRDAGVVSHVCGNLAFHHLPKCRDHRERENVCAVAVAALRAMIQAASFPTGPQRPQIPSWMRDSSCFYTSLALQRMRPLLASYRLLWKQ